MKTQNLIFFGLFFLLVFVSSNYFINRKHIAVKNVDTYERPQVPVSAPLQATPQAKIPSPTKNAESADISSVRGDAGDPEDSLFTSEKIAERKKHPLNLCRYIGGNIEKTDNFAKLINRSRKKEGGIEKTIWMIHQMSVTHFMIDLPVISKFFAERERGIVHTKEEITLNYSLQEVELQNNYLRAEAIYLRSYYTMVLARAAALNPELFHGSEMAAMCTKLETIDTPLSRQELNNLMYSFLQRAQMEASEVKFNPTYEPFIEIRMSPDGPYYFTSNDKDQ